MSNPLPLVRQHQLQTDPLHVQEEFFFFYSIIKQSRSSAIPLTLWEESILKHTLEGMTDKHNKVCSSKTGFQRCFMRIKEMNFYGTRNFLLLKESHMNAAERSSTTSPRHLHNPHNASYYFFFSMRFSKFIYFFYEGTDLPVSLMRH